MPRKSSKRASSSTATIDTTVERLPLPKCCEGCGSDGAVVLASRCHTGAGMQVTLTGNVLTLACEICEAVVSRLEVTCQLRGI